MAQLKPPQLKALRRAMMLVFSGQTSPGELHIFFSDLGLQLFDVTTPNAILPVQVADALAKLNAESRIAAVLDELEASFPEAAELQLLIGSLRPSLGPAPGSDAAARLGKLAASGLLLDGLAFINRSRLREILTDLLDPFSAARVALITGASLCGKTWSHHLIRAHCSVMNQAKLVVLDMQKIQPGNDPTIIWTELLRRLFADRPPPPPPAEDTKRGQYSARLVEEVCLLWEAWEDPRSNEKPWPLIVIDHLEKNAAAAVGPAVVDFAEALAAAAVKRDFRGARVLLLGFPRAFVVAPEMAADAVAAHEAVEPLSDAEIGRYLDDVAQAVGRGPPPLIAQEASRLLAEADRFPRPEDRRAALMVLSSKLGAHVSALARAAS